MPKKKTTLTIEERLQQALVPAEEQPYEVPENWVWVRLGSLLKEIKNGTTIKQDKSGNGFSVTRIESLQNQTIDLMRVGTILETEKIKETDWYKSGDITLSHINSIEHVGKTALITDAMLPLVHGMNLLRLRFFEIYTPDLFQLYSQTYQYKNEIRSRINMAVNQVSINQKQLSSLEIPLPPLSEQQRIVERIEELFAKLDEAKERLQEAADSFAVRKAAILHKAFTGELTKQWRRENGVSDESWEDVSLDSVCKSIYDGDHMPPPKSETGIPFLVISNVNTGFISFEKCRFVPEEYYDGLSETRTPEIGDILYTIVGSYGIPVMVDIDKKFCFQRHMALLKPKDIYNRFLWRQLQTQSFFEQATSIATGTAQLTVPIKGLRKLIVKCPTLPEQHEIVCLIDDLLARERKAQQATEQALASIDLMKKSILARAFRGELGTNKASEASALELLRQVLAEN